MDIEVQKQQQQQQHILNMLNNMKVPHAHVGLLNGGSSNAGLQQQVAMAAAAAAVAASGGGMTQPAGILVERTHQQQQQEQVSVVNVSNCVNGGAVMDSNTDSSSYLEGLLQEQRSLKGREGVDLIKHLLGQEIERLQTTGKSLLVRTEDRKLSDITKDKAVKLTIRVLVPVKDHPKFNFVGKLLGPRGNSLKRLQEETMTKMAILGRGSMRDKQKEEELRQTGDPKFLHLQDELHVEVTAMAPPAEAYARLAYALTELRRYLVPDYNDDIRQEQMREIKLMKTSKRNSSPDAAADNNGTPMGSATEDDSCSPDSPGSTCEDHEAQAHPALRGLNGKIQHLKQGQLMHSIGTDNERRSVLSLLTRGRIIQQKEHLMEVYHQLPGYGVYEHMSDLPMNNSANDDNSGHLVSGLLKTSAPVERRRFRHDPYRLPLNI